MTTDPLDPVAIMADHEPCTAGHSEPLCKGCNHAAVHPCAFYRLAAEVATLREQNSAAWTRGWMAAKGASSQQVDEHLDALAALDDPTEPEQVQR